MDVDLLSKMVGELILDRDEVSLPGVGTFVAEIVPSTFSDKGYTINPPYRRLSFRQRSSSDTSLVELYAQSNCVDFITASSIIEKYLIEMKDVLKTRKTIILPGLGRLRATRENNFFFIPDEDLSIYPEGFGLEPVSLKTHVETEDEVQTVVASLHSMLEPSPVVEEPSPVIEEPAPVVEEPAPVVEEPSPVIEEPSPAIEKPSPVIEEPAPVRRFAWWKIVAATLAFAVLLLALFLLLARIAPDFIDRILYTEEELELLKLI